MVIGSIFYYQNEKSNENKYDESDYNKITDFYKANVDLFSNIKNSLYTINTDYINIYLSKGNIAFGDGEGKQIYLNDQNLIDYSKRYYDIAKYPDPSICCRKINGYKTVEFLFYYKTNRMSAGIIFTQADVSKTQYIKLGTGWYFYNIELT